LLGWWGRREAPLGLVAHSIYLGHIDGVAKPIEPTPPLEGEEAEKLLAELKDICSPQEAERRLRVSREFLAKVMKPKGWRQSGEN
jgi:hypothetical protein